MATQAQFEANRRNAQRSTGPKTAQGKHNSSRNSVKHGILAKVLAETESFQELLLSLYETLRPQDELQRFLVDQVALCMIRLQRSAAWEAQTLARPAYIPLPPGRQYEGEEPPEVPASVRVPAFVGSEGGQALLRYESACNRQIKRNLELLMKLQSASWGRPEGLRDPYLDELEGAAPSVPMCPEDTWPKVGEPRFGREADSGESRALGEPGPSGPGDHTATQPCVSHARESGADTPHPGPSGPGYAPGIINDWDTEFSLGLAPSPLQGEGRDEGRPTGPHNLTETKLASFRNIHPLPGPHDGDSTMPPQMGMHCPVT